MTIQGRIIDPIRLVVRGYVDGVYFCPSPMPKEMPLLKIRVVGRGLRPGHIPVPLLLKICGEAQKAINRQAEALAGKRSLRRGRPTAEVAQECTLDLVGLKKGSTTLAFVQASDQQSLLPIGMEAVSAVGAALKFVSRKRGDAALPDYGVLNSLNSLGEIFQGDSPIEKLQWIVPARNGTKRVSIEFNAKLLPKLKAHLQPELPLASGILATKPSSPLEGTLELTEGKGRIVPAVGSPTPFNFGSDKAATVLEATLKPVKATVDPKTHKLQGIEITSSPTLHGERGFFVAKTIDQLIAEQGIHPVTDLKLLGGAIPDEDVDAFVAEIYRDREA
jgi:hypothetical protein